MSFFGSLFNKNKNEGEYNKKYSPYNKDEGEQPFSSTIDTDSQSEQKAPKQESNTRRIPRTATPKRTGGNLKKWLVSVLLLIVLFIAMESIIKRILSLKENRRITIELKEKDVPNMDVLDIEIPDIEVPEVEIPDVEVPEIEVDEEAFNYEEDLKRGLGLTNKESKKKNVVKDSSSESSVSKSKISTKSNDYAGLSTSEIIERRTHENVVKQARRAGVSTEGTTSEIIDRITHANVVEQAKRVGVSTDGTTSEIIDRITHANVVEQAKRVGVSTEGSTSEIIDRITHANVVEQAKRVGVSTDGTTSEIIDRITRKNLERMNY